MKKRMTIMITALVIVFGGLVGFNVVKGIMIKRYLAHYEFPPVSVSSVKAFTRDWQPRIPAVGNFVAINGVEVNAETAGNVTELFFDSGEYIDKDGPLIQIDDRVEQANLKFNQSELALQKINYKRQTDLLKHNATSSESVDTANAKLLQAQANVEKTEAEIRQKHITAPFSGKLGIRLVNLGEYISPGKTSIVTLQSMDPLYLEFYLPEQLITKIHVHQPLTFRIEQYPSIRFKGEISAINSRADPNTHNILIQASVPNCSQKAIDATTPSPAITVTIDKTNSKKIIQCHSDWNTKHHIRDFVLIPGMFAGVDIEEPVIHDVIVLPTTAISYSLYGNSVFIIQDSNKKDANGKPVLTVKRVFVSTGEQDGNYTMIKAGLAAGQLVVGSGELKLEDNTRVTINNDVQLKDVDIKQLDQ